MLVRIDPKNNSPLYEQIVQQIKELCAKGILSTNEKLPSVRELSSQIVINPNTVSKAYQELERQGIIITIRGRGTFVAERDVIEPSEKEREKMKEALEKIVINSFHLGITKEELKDWIERMYSEMKEGRRDGN